MGDCTKESGTCSYCREGCTIKPGWFLPGEAEAAASLMGLTLPEFFARFLAVDWWVADYRIGRDTFVLSPAVRGNDAGTEFPGDPRGTCVFYRDERCQIHEAKPHECRERWCGERTPGTTHEDVARAWSEYQGQIAELLGREPMAEAFGDDGILGMFGSVFGDHR